MGYKDSFIGVATDEAKITTRRFSDLLNLFDNTTGINLSDSRVVQNCLIIKANVYKGLLQNDLYTIITANIDFLRLQ